MTRMRTAGFFHQFNMVRGRLGRLAHEIAVGLEALHRVQFDEPWQPGRKAANGHR